MLKIQENTHMHYYLLLYLNVLVTWDLLSKIPFVLAWLFRHQICFPKEMGSCVMLVPYKLPGTYVHRHPPALETEELWLGES